MIYRVVPTEGGLPLVKGNLIFKLIPKEKVSEYKKVLPVDESSLDSLQVYISASLQQY